MIHVITAANRHLYASEMDQLFRLRAKIFKETLGWAALTVVDGREMDAYDDDLAIYLLGIEPDGVISVGVRVRPTQDKSLLLDQFPHLVAGRLDDHARADVWESCRFFASSRARGPAGARRREELRLAMVAAAHARGVRRIVAITDMVFLPPLLQNSWTTRLLGLPAVYDEGECVALEIDCGDEALRLMRERYGAADDRLLERTAVPQPAPPVIAPAVNPPTPLSASELREISRLVRTLSPQDAQVLANLIKRIAIVHETEGEAAALAVISRLQTALVPPTGSTRASPRPAAIRLH